MLLSGKKNIGHSISHLFEAKYTLGTKVALQDVQLLTFYEQVRHGDWHGVHLLLSGMKVGGQLD